MIWSDGYSIAGVSRDPLSQVNDRMRIDLCLAIAAMDSNLWARCDWWTT